MASAKAVDNYGRISSFLKGLCFRGTLTRVELRQVLRRDGMATFVNSWPVAELQQNGQSLDLDQLAREIVEWAESDAKGLSAGRLQTYAVLGYLEGEAEAIRLPLPVRTDQGDYNPKDAFIDSEEPNATGQMSQVLRHNEAYARGGQHFFLRILESYERRESRYEQREADRDRLHVEMMGSLYNLARMQEERDFRLHQLKRREKLEDFAIDKVGTLGTLFMAQLKEPETVGREPKGGAEIRAIIGWFYKHQTKQAQAMGVFSPTQMGALQKLGAWYQKGILHATNQPEIVEAVVKAFLDEIDGDQIAKLMGDPETDPPTPGLFDDDDTDGKAAFQALWQLYAPTPKRESATVQ